MSEVNYADLHCDSVTFCCDSGKNLCDSAGQVSFSKLKKSGCAAQCFAIFTEGENAAADFERYAAFYNAQISASGDMVPAVRRGDIAAAIRSAKIAALLTVENLGFLDGDVSKIAELSRFGVRMASLVWNNVNSFAYPNLVFRGEMPDFAACEPRGLTPAGKNAVRALEENGILLDVSHLSDGGVDDVLELCRLPVVASHSNCRAVCPVSRNLTDGQIKKIADTGGLIGLNYCRDFVGGEDVREALYSHLTHLINIGGEDVAALGSDFDGIPPYECLSDCLKVRGLLTYFADRGIKERVLEKIALKNFMRVFD